MAHSSATSRSASRAALLGAATSRNASRVALLAPSTTAMRPSASSMLTGARSTLTLPSKHRLLSISARPSALGLSGASTVALSGGVAGVASGQPQPDGDVYIINAINAKGAMSAAYTQDKKLLAVGETSGNIRLFRTGRPDELCCLSLQMAAEGRGQGQQHQQLRQLGASTSRPWSGKAVAVTCLRPWPAEASRPTLLASYADGRIRVWDVKHGAIVQELAEGRQCLGLAVSPDFRHFVSLGDDGGVHLYDATTATLVAKLEHSGFSDTVDGHKSRVFSGAFHPHDTNGVVTGGWDNLLQFWDVRVAHAVRRAGETMIGGTEALDISPDGRELLSCSWRNVDQLQLWDYATARLVETVRPDNVQSYLYAGRYLTDGLLCCGGSSVNLFRLVHIGQKVTMGNVSGLGHGVYSVALGPTGAKFMPSPSLNNGKNIHPQNRDKCPRIAVCSDSKILELEVY